MRFFSRKTTAAPTAEPRGREYNVNIFADCRWEDGVEQVAYTNWTPEMAEQLEQDGYTITKMTYQAIYATRQCRASEAAAKVRPVVEYFLGASPSST